MKHPRSSILVAFLWFCASVAFGQENGCFTFQTDSIGCAPFRVRLLNCFTPGLPVAYNFDLVGTPNAYFQASIDNHGDTSTTYPTSGIYIIAQAPSGQFRNPFKKRVAVYDQNSKPVFHLKTCADGISILFRDTIFKTFSVTVGTNVPSIVNLISGDREVFFPVVGLGISPTKIGVTVTGTYPANCGNTSVRDSISVYSQIPVAQFVKVIQFPTGPETGLLDVTLQAYQGIEYRVSATNKGTEVGQFRMPAQGISRLVQLSFPVSSDSATLFLTPLNTCNATIQDSLYAFPPLTRVSTSAVLYESRYMGDSLVISKNNLQVLVANPISSDSILASGLCGKATDLQFSYSIQPSKRYIYSASYTLSGNSIAPTYTELAENIRNDSLLLIYRPASPILTVSMPDCGTSIPSGHRILTKVKICIVDGCVASQFVDSCQNHINLSACPLKLRASQQGNCVALAWNATSPFNASSKQCRLLVFNSEGFALAQLPVSSAALSYRDCSRYLTSSLTYRLECISLDSSNEGRELSNLESVQKKYQLQLPTAFSPNDDQTNDTFEIAAPGYQLKVDIFNRWGECVFHKKGNDLAVWDGKFKGKTAPAGNYLIKLEVMDGKSVILSENKMLALIQ